MLSSRSPEKAKFCHYDRTTGGRPGIPRGIYRGCTNWYHCANLPD